MSPRLLYRYEGAGAFRALNTGTILNLDPADPPAPPPIEPPPNDYGTPTNRPTITTRPTPTDTGNTTTTSTTMGGTEALAAALNQPPGPDGFRELHGAHIDGGITLTKAIHHSIRFVDCTIAGTGTYVVKAFHANDGISPAGYWPEFVRCTITGGSSATIIGGQARFIRCRVEAGQDLVKPFGPLEFYGCLIRWTWHSPGSHADVFQITAGAAGTVIRGSACEGFNHPDSPSGNGGSPDNAVLQTGTQTGHVGPVEWHNNWLDGGHYTIRGRKPADSQYRADYVFRGNRFGRDTTYGPLQNTGYAGFDFDSSNVWDDTNQPVTG